MPSLLIVKVVHGDALVKHFTVTSSKKKGGGRGGMDVLDQYQLSQPLGSVIIQFLTGVFIVLSQTLNC